MSVSLPDVLLADHSANDIWTNDIAHSTAIKLQHILTLLPPTMSKYQICQFDWIISRLLYRPEESCWTNLDYCIYSTQRPRNENYRQLNVLIAQLKWLKRSWSLVKKRPTSIINSRLTTDHACMLHPGVFKNSEQAADSNFTLTTSCRQKVAWNWNAVHYAEFRRRYSVCQTFRVLFTQRGSNPGSQL